MRAATRLVTEFAFAGALSPPSGSCVESLSPRERDVLKLVMKGLRCDEIAARLTLSRSTVKSHIRSICQKLNVRDRAELIIVAYQARLTERMPRQDSFIADDQQLSAGSPVR